MQENVIAVMEAIEKYAATVAADQQMVSGSVRTQGAFVEHGRARLRLPWSFL